MGKRQVKTFRTNFLLSKSINFPFLLLIIKSLHLRYIEREKYFFLKRFELDYKNEENKHFEGSCELLSLNLLLR